jgi:hypothetical protein
MIDIWQYAIPYGIISTKREHKTAQDHHKNIVKGGLTMGKHVPYIAIFTGLFLLPFLFPLPADAQFGFAPQQAPQQSHKGILSTAHGRFAFGQVSDSAEDKFMLDTFTGRLWRMNKRTGIGLCLTPVPYRSEDGECSAIPENIPASKDSKGKEK